MMNERNGAIEQRNVQRSGRDHRLLMIVATAVPVWNFYGFAINFFRDTWTDAPIPVIPISYGLNACFVVLLPLLKGGGHLQLKTAALLGSAMTLWSAVGMAFTPATDIAYTAIPTVLGAATAALAARLLRQRQRDEARRAKVPFRGELRGQDAASRC